MKIAIMQPYFFPYLGYFQLIQSVDNFVVYDDVNFIKRGWVNRNNILLNNKAQLITIPLLASSQNKLIKDIEIVREDKWKVNLFKTIEQAYRRAPYFTPTLELLESVVFSNTDSISELNIQSIKQTLKYLNIEKKLITSSKKYDNDHLKAQERILNICLIEGSSHYNNLPGGMHLYDKAIFEEHGIVLNFIEPTFKNYKQFNNEFVSGLSMIDILMFNKKEDVKQMLNEYSLQ